MSGFIEGEGRTQATLFPERLDDYITEENAIRVVGVFIDGIDLSGSWSIRASTASRTASCSQRVTRRSLPVVH